MTKKDKEEICKLIDDVRYQLLDRINNLNKPTECCGFPDNVSRDYQKDTYEIVRRMSYDMEKTLMKKEIDKMKEEQKNIESRIRNAEISMAFKENNFYNN